jgi:ParB family transcriptional regulator, chromosome partitioning protein
VSKFNPKLAAKVSEASLQQHREANYRDDFDAGRQHIKIRLDKIDPNPYQPRIQFNDIAELANSISEDGLLQPISVRQIGERYQLVAGERRLHAHKHLGKPTIEAIVIAVDDAKSATLALAENIERQDLSDFEVAESIAKLRTLFPKSKTDLAKSLGIQSSDLYRYESFGKLPEVIRARLFIKPALLSRSASDDIVRALKDLRSGPDLNARIDKALELLEEGKLYQTKVAAFLTQASVKPKDARVRPTYLKNSKGVRVGSFQTGSHEVVLKISKNALTREQLRDLQKFVEELVD